MHLAAMDHVNPRSLRSVLLCLPLLLIAFGAEASEALKLGDPAPDWILANGQQENISFYQDSADRPAVLLFWATWCPYCEELMPKLEKLRGELADGGVRFYALNIWEDGDPVAHMKKKGYQFTLLLNADQVAKRYGVRGTPGLFVVDADKSIRYIRGKDSSAGEVYRAVKAALGGQHGQLTGAKARN